MRRLPPRLPALILSATLLAPAAHAYQPPAPVFDGGVKRQQPLPAARPIARAPVEAGIPPEDLRTEAADPPTLVGRVARAAGTATLRLPGAEEWQPATLNTALTAGTALWTEPGARLAMEVAQARLFLDGGTALQLDALDDDELRATLARGTAFLRVAGLGPEDGPIEVATPEARFATAVDGRYLLEAADGSRPGRIAVFEGAAEVTVAGATEPLRLAPGEALLLPSGGPPERAEAGAATPLIAWALGAEPRRAIPQAARGMTGVAELSAYGAWGQSPEYGDIWYPPVREDWAPYRDGNWVWREPWGWTWVDAAPWGFAPSHYGRWIRVGPRWAWAPQPVRVADVRVRPAWAPALVAFFGADPGYAARPVGWVPLAPREPYYPWYRASPRYVQRVNIRQVANVANLRNAWIERGGRDLRWDDDRRGAARFHDRRLEEFRHHRAAVQVPGRVLEASLPVRPEARRLRPEETRRADVIAGLPLRPAPDTSGLTARGAERFGLPRESLRRPDAAPAPPPPVRAALADPRPDPDAGRREERRRQLDALREGRRDAPRAAPDEADAVRREERRRQSEALRDARPGLPRAPDDAARRERIEALRGQDEQARRQQIEAMRQQQQEQARRQGDESRRQQQDQARRQDDESRRQRAEAMRQQQQEQARRQGDESRRQQLDAMRQQQQEAARRQQEDSRRQQMEAMRQQQDAARRQQMDAMRQQQQEAARRQHDESRRQQQQQEQARRQQDVESRRQQAEQRRQNR